VTRRILVTGGAGFMGSGVVRHLLDRYPDYRVVALDALTYAGNLENFPTEVRTDPRFSFWHGNIRNVALVEDLASEADAIVHLAAETHVPRSIADNTIFLETDVLGTQSVVTAALKHRVERLIHISSSEVYGSALADPMTEAHPLNPTSPYAAAKAGADRLVYSYFTTFGLPVIILRPFNNYGPHQHLEKMVPRFITSALLEEPLTLHGDGLSTRDWLYVGDFCEAVDLALHAPLSSLRGETINLGTGVDTSILAVAEHILARLGKPCRLITHIEERPAQVRRHIGSTEKAAALLGWRARTSLADGLDRTIRWYAEHHDWWRKLMWMRSVVITGPTGSKVVY
jgi:dTDP-glucose 4,6-dehydratase